MPRFEHSYRRTLSNCLFSLFLFHDSDPDPVRFVAIVGTTTDFTAYAMR